MNFAKLNSRGRGDRDTFERLGKDGVLHPLVVVEWMPDERRSSLVLVVRLNEASGSNSAALGLHAYALSVGKSMSVSATLLMKFVNRNCTAVATISTICASLKPAFLTAAKSSSETLPRVSVTRLAN